MGACLKNHARGGKERVVPMRCGRRFADKKPEIYSKLFKVAEPGNYSIEEANQFFAVSCNNAVWRLLCKADQSKDDKNEIINLAHASLWHWSRRADCKMKNLQRGEYLIALAYVNAGRKEPAMYHAKRCVEITEANSAEREDFDLPYARLIMGMALRLNGSVAEAKKYLMEAERLGDEIKNEKDKEIFVGDLRDAMAAF